MLLCEARNGTIHRFIASKEFAERTVPKLSRDHAGQLKFHVTREKGSFFLDVPGAARVSIDGLLERFENLVEPGRIDRSPSDQQHAHRTSVTPSGRGGLGTAGSHRELGNRGYENLEDYLLPVIKLILSGTEYRDAFRKIAGALDVRYNTVSAQCTRMLGLNTAEFVELVKSRRIIRKLISKFPDRKDLIDKELRV